MPLKLELGYNWVNNRLGLKLVSDLEMVIFVAHVVDCCPTGVSTRWLATPSPLLSTELWHFVNKNVKKCYGIMAHRYRQYDIYVMIK